MYLKSEGLYETKQGKRYRVTYDPVDDCFTCSSFGGTWSLTGYATCKVGMDGKRKKPHLVCEVEEKRWVPVSLEEYATLGSVMARFWGKHVRREVTRECAKGIALAKQTEKIPDLFNPTDYGTTDYGTTDYGTIETVDQEGFKVSFDWSFSKDIKTYLIIETSNGVEISIPL